MIEDQELREIYQVSGKEHVDNLETGLLTLEQDPQNTELLATLLREAHSLKGDSRVVGVKTVEVISHRLEELFGRLKNNQMEWSKALGDKMYNTVGALGKLVHEAVTDEPSGVNSDQIISQLNEFLPDVPQTPPQNSHSNGNGNGNGHNHHKQFRLFIEDQDLREVYQLSSQEHLEKLRSHLALLEEHPQDPNYTEELLSESESFELDSRFVGQETLESLIHKFREVCEALKAAKISFPEVAESLKTSIEVIDALVHEALTGESAEVNYEQTLKQLEEVNLKTETSDDVKTVKNYGRRKSDRDMDTIRVPMRYLDTLMTHTGELTVTKTRLAHTHERLKNLVFLWQDWKSQNTNTLRRRNIAEKLDELIPYLDSSIAENNTRLDLIARELDEKVRTLRLLPLSTIFLLFPRLVRDLAQEQDKEVEFVMEGGEITVDKQILEEMKDPLLHLLRNAVDHALELPDERKRLGKNPVGKIWLKAYNSGSNIVIEVGDDGRGLDLEKIKQTAIKKKLYRVEELAQMSSQQVRSLIFLPGFSTRSFVTEISGRGVGLDVVRSNVEKLKGNILIDSTPHQGSVFRVQLRSTVATLNVMLFEVQGLIHGLPLEAIEKTLLIKPEEIYTLEGKPTITVDNQPVTLVKMADLLELPDLSPTTVQKQRQRAMENQRFISAILLNVDGQTLAFEVETLKEVLDVVMKPQTKLLKRVRNVIGATILGTGDVCMILNPHDLIKSVQKATQTLVSFEDELGEVQNVQRPVVLLVEDSIAVRTQEKRILDKAGYEVIIAVDGAEGYNKLRSGIHVDAIISDVEMPNMNGLEFTAKVRQHAEYREIPLILVTSLASEEDKRKGAQAGANAYIVKGQFNQELLIETLDRLV